MQLTHVQLRQLQKMHEFRTVPPTIGSYIKLGWRAQLLVLLIGAIGIFLFLWAGWPLASGFFAGMVVATYARDIGWYRRMVQSWPLMREITDWNRVDELLSQSHGSAA